MDEINSKSILYRIPDEVLSMILQRAVTRNTPFYIDTHESIGRLRIASDSDANAVGPLSSARPDGQEAHIADWIVMNFTCKRFKKLGRDAFFAAKVIAMPSTLPAALLRPHHPWHGPSGFAYQMLKNGGNPKLDLACVRHLVLTDARERTPLWMTALPKLLNTHFPALRQCMLIYSTLPQDEMNMWQVTAAMTLARPAREELREMLVDTEMSERVVLEETVHGRYTNWDENTKNLETYVYPILRFKAEAMRKIKQKEKEKEEKEKEKEKEEKEKEEKEEEEEEDKEEKD